MFVKTCNVCFTCIFSDKLDLYQATYSCIVKNQYAECHYAKCLLAKCRGANLSTTKFYS